MCGADLHHCTGRRQQSRQIRFRRVSDSFEKGGVRCLESNKNGLTKQIPLELLTKNSMISSSRPSTTRRRRAKISGLYASTSCPLKWADASKKYFQTWAIDSLRCITYCPSVTAWTGRDNG